MTDPRMPGVPRAVRRRREREAAKARRLADQQYARAAKIIPELVADLEVGRDKALERGWPDVADQFDRAIELLEDGQGLDAHAAVHEAARLAEAHGDA